MKNENKLDCPYDFTSRCTMGRCDCKPKDELVTFQAPEGSLILSTESTLKRCKKLFKNWIKDNFKDK